MLRNYVQGDVYQLPMRNAKGRTFVIEGVEDNTVTYTYVESGLRGKADRRNQFLKTAEKIESIDDDVLHCEKDFFTCWVEGSNLPIKKKYPSMARAKEAATYLIVQKDCASVHILKHVGTAKKPTNVVFDIIDTSNQLENTSGNTEKS